MHVSESKLSLEENERRSRHNDDDEKSVDEDLKHSKVATRQAVSSLALTNFGAKSEANICHVFAKLFLLIMALHLTSNSL